MNEKIEMVTMTLEEYQLQKNMKVLKIALDGISEEVGKEIKFDDCFNIIIENDKVYTTIEIPDYIDFQKHDVTELIEQYLIKEVINELAGSINEQIEDDIE